ncbi:MAG: hypothetical protein HYR63_19855 [Proteobacteria bacterium]|nr:hypothetical protein [Pseudomonadota bacterium]
MLTMPHVSAATMVVDTRDGPRANRLRLAARRFLAAPLGAFKALLSAACTRLSTMACCEEYANQTHPRGRKNSHWSELRSQWGVWQ